MKEKVGEKDGGNKIYSWKAGKESRKEELSREK